MILPWVLILVMHLADMGGGGDMQVTLRFSTEDLCKSVRRAIWSQLKDAPDGELGECTRE